MSLYLKPPRGFLNLYTFQDCVEQRLDLYNNIFNRKVEISNFNCLVEDSPLDRTGHYLFRLYAYFNASFQQTFLENEVKLFLLRLESYAREDARYFLKRILKHSKECLNENGTHESLKVIYRGLISLCQQMLYQNCLKHIFEESHINAACEKFTLKVPFYLCASLISNREVNLNKGNAELQCSYWKKLFCSIYETYLKKAINDMKYSYNVQLAAHDVRIKSMFKSIQIFQHKNGSFADNDVRMKFNILNIDAESKLFPLCMINLYKVLQKTNRLSHNERFDFSLFMKGIGISLQDSMTFWESAYSKQHSSCSKCSHNWQNNEKRYIYGIRHLYGLEGGRKNYKVRSCNYFQEKTLSATEDGGCPFKHFDDDILRKILKKLLPNKEDDIEVMIYERKESPTEACKLFYEQVFQSSVNYKHSQGITSAINFVNPVEYYISLKNLLVKHNDAEVDSGIHSLNGLEMS